MLDKLSSNIKYRLPSSPIIIISLAKCSINPPTCYCLSNTRQRFHRFPLETLDSEIFNLAQTIQVRGNSSFSFFPSSQRKEPPSRNIRDEKHEGRASRIPRGNSRRGAAHDSNPPPFIFLPTFLLRVCKEREREAKRREMRFKGSSWDVLVRPSVVEGYRIRPTIRKSMRRICISICRTREKKHVCRVQEEKEVEGEQQPFRDIKLFDL